jgi:hypothetical protein
LRFIKRRPEKALLLYEVRVVVVEKPWKFAYFYF